ncbi:MAG: hypothetical protein NTX86_04840 [Candidatus Dependentiae bacterium]|nr:hypothetical protein [Candidatus Dependentiae bacterium]
MANKETFVEELCAILLKNKMVTDIEAVAMKDVFKDSEQENFDDFLLKEGFLESSDLLRALSVYYRVPSFDVQGHFFETFLLHQFPKDFLLRHSVIPLEVDQNMIIVVASRPEDPGLESAMREFVSYEIEFFVGINGDIIDAIEEFYDRSLTTDAQIEDNDMREDERLEDEAMAKDEIVEELTYSDIVYRDEDDKK